MAIPNYVERVFAQPGAHKRLYYELQAVCEYARFDFPLHWGFDDGVVQRLQSLFPEPAPGEPSAVKPRLSLHNMVQKLFIPPQCQKRFSQAICAGQMLYSML